MSRYIENLGRLTPFMKAHLAHPDGTSRTRSTVLTVVDVPNDKAVLIAPQFDSPVKYRLALESTEGYEPGQLVQIDLNTGSLVFAEEGATATKETQETASRGCSSWTDLIE